MKTLLLLGLILGTVCSGQEIIRKKAVLILPDEIECPRGGARYLTGHIGIRWDEQEPVELNVWRNSSGKNGTAAHYRLKVELTVYDEAGSELQRQFFVSIPPIPDGTTTLRPGEYRKFPFFLWNGQVVFPRPGNYCAVVTFYEAWTGKKNVQFTTNRRWFKVVDADPKKPDA